jgi:hypothetical protein
MIGIIRTVSLHQNGARRDQTRADTTGEAWRGDLRDWASVRNEESINADNIDLAANAETGLRPIPEFSSIGHAIDIGFSF